MYHVDKAAFMLTKRQPLPALELKNSYMVSNVKPKPTTVTVVPIPAQSTRQLRSATARPSGQPSRSAGVAKSSSKSVKLSSVKSVNVSELKKALTVAVPQVAPPTNSAVGAPGGEALSAMPVEPATLPMVSSREASPIGEF